MKRMIQLKRAISLLSLMALGLTCFAFAFLARAVVPPPDGGYPGGNTAEGQNALFNLTTGTYNTAVGWLSLESLSTGSFNTSTGAGSLLFNAADNNTAFGATALLLNTIGFNNTAVGATSLLNNTEGFDNTAVGTFALYYNTTGNRNTATGVSALERNITGINNTASGRSALERNTTGHNNTASGSGALFFNSTGEDNTADGGSALFFNTSGIRNTASGALALFSNTTGDENTAVGSGALFSNATGFENTAIGDNTLVNNTTGSLNIALGHLAGHNLTTGDSNVDIGNAGVAGESATIRIGQSQTRTFIAGIRGRTTGNANAVAVLIDSAGQLGTISSSRRFKSEIKPMDNTSEAIHALKPVTFRYKTDKTGTPQFGLIAEEVAEVNPDLVVRDENGNIYTVRYDAVNAMLLNEFLKEHRRVAEQNSKLERQDRRIQEQEITTAQLKKELERLVARANEHDSEIQRVSDQVEMDEAASQLVANDQ